MILAKIIFLILLSIAFGSLLSLDFNRGIRITEKLILIILFVFSLSITINANIMRLLANLLNIKRGVDLLFYIYIISSLWLMIRTHIRINLVERKINKLISKIALQDEKQDN